MKRMTLCPTVLALGLLVVLATPAIAQQASQNIPVLPVIPQYNEDGVEDPAWYLKGDGYLQRQVEPTIAVSTRNPDHLLSFFVDYRAVDIGSDVGLGEETQTWTAAMATTSLLLSGLVSLPEIQHLESPPIAAAEAWVGGSASHDGGMTWSGFFMPGASFDGTDFSVNSPVYGLEAATDPVAVAGPCGYVYVAFMAFTRGEQSKMVVARFQDLNDSESGRTWQYQGTFLLETGNNAEHGYFLDKPHINLDPFSDEEDFAAYGQYYDPEEYQCGHRVMMSYSTFNGFDNDGKFQSKINFAVSVDRGETWDKSKIQQPYSQNQGSFIAVDPRPKSDGGGSVYLVWRHFNSPDTIVLIKSTDYGKKWTKPVELTGDVAMQPFDQPTIPTEDGIGISPRIVTFRSNAFPTAAVTAPSGNVFVAWQEFVGIDPGDPDTYGKPKEFDIDDPHPSSPRIVMVKSTDGGSTWSDRAAVDMEPRDQDSANYPPPGFGALPTPRDSGPQVKPWFSFGGGELALGYTESRGMYRRVTDENGIPTLPAQWYHQDVDLSGYGFISDIDRVMDFRVALLDPSTGQLDEPSIQVSRYPVSHKASFSAGNTETVADIAPVIPEFCDPDNGPPEYCQPSLNFVNKNHSASGHAAFMGDYPGLSPILPMTYDGTSWRWATSAQDVPYPAFHVVFPDNRNLIPPVEDQGLEEWQRYPYYSFPTADTSYQCQNVGSRNADVLTAKVNAELVLSAPTTYKQGSFSGQQLGYPISVFNRSHYDHVYQLEITQGVGFASFAVDPGQLEEGASETKGLVEIFAYSSTSQMVYVDAGAEGRIRVDVTQVEWNDDLGEWVPAGGGEKGYVVLYPDPSNPPTSGSEAQTVNIDYIGVETYSASFGDLAAINPFVQNPFVQNPFVQNPFVQNPFVQNSSINDEVEVIDTTWSVQATGDSGAGTYLPVINIDNAEDLYNNYAFQLLIYKNAFHGTIGPSGCQPLNVPNSLILSNVSQNPFVQNPFVQNPFVQNPFVQNPFVQNPFVQNPFVQNSAITVAPADGVEEEQDDLNQPLLKNLIPDDGTLRVPRVAEKIFITLRAFKLKEPGSGELRYQPTIDEPAFSFVPAKCTTDTCIKYFAPDLIPVGVDDSSLENDVVSIGDWITFPLGGWSVKNQGTTDATPDNRPLRHGYYLTTDDTVEFNVDGTPANACLLHTEESGDPGEITIPAGGELQQEAQYFQIDSEDCEITAGLYNLILYVDDLEEVSEYNEENNKEIAVVAITVEAPNVPPVAESQSVTTLEDTPINIELEATDEEGEPLTFQIDDEPLYGSVELVGDSATYTPNPEFSGEDSFTFTAYDGENYSVPATVSITVNSFDDPPKITDVYLEEVLEDQATYGYVIVEDPDTPVEDLTFEVTRDPIHGAVILDPATGEFTYTSGENSNEPDNFEVTVTDPTSKTGSFTVWIYITPVNDAPTASDESFNAFEDEVFIGSLVGLGSDVDGDPLTYHKEFDPTNGSVTISPNGSFEYKPLSEFSGTDAFTYYVQDPNQAASAPATVTIYVAPTRDFVFLGLQDPWRESPLYTVRVGSAVPLKWQYAWITDPFETPIPSEFVNPIVAVQGPFDCGDPNASGLVEEHPLYPGASDYQYSTSTYLHQYNWDTNGKTAGNCYAVRVFNSADGFWDGDFRIKIKK